MYTCQSQSPNSSHHHHPPPLSPLGVHTFVLYFCVFIYFYWSIVDLQWCVSFRCAAKWFSHMYIWDRLGPGPLCCSACTWTHLSPSNKQTRKLYGTKNNCVHAQLGQILDKRYTETKNPTAAFEEPGAKAGGRERKQGTEHARCTQHHLRGGQNT